MAQSGFEVKNNTVTPEFGYGEFIYSAQIWLSGSTPDLSGKFRMELKIYDGDKLIHSESSLERRLSMEEIQKKLSEPFIFGPYNFKDKFGISSTSNASYEFIIYRYGGIVARSKANGPIVQPPEIMGSPQYDATPYFYRGLSVSTSFRDMEGLSPTCHLEIKGPLDADRESSWTTSEMPCLSSGKNVYTCIQLQDFQTYRDGGNFSFNVVYNNLRLDPLIFGPYDFTILPYSPVVERLIIPQYLDYTNFSISAYIKDEGVKIVGGSPMGSVADLIVTHPQKGEAIYTSNSPTLQGGYVVFDWDKTSVPFSRNDASLSKEALFQARLRYRNENWNYGAESSNITFAVVEEVPRLEVRYDPVVYVRSGQTATQDISAIVSFSKGPGDMRFHLTGPAQDQSYVDRGTSMGGNRYQYKWKVSFDDRHINKNYTISMAFVHPSLEGGEFAFDDRYIQVVPVSVRFQESSVSPYFGRWNDSYTYSLNIDSSLDLDVMLQTYDPCSREWEDMGAKKALAGESVLNWTLSPFYYECPEMVSEGAMYRFKAGFAGVDYTSKPYRGPSFRGGNPSIVSLDYDPVVYLSEDGRAIESISAVIEYAGGQGEAILGVAGQKRDFEETKQGIAIGGNRYRYDWSLPFTNSDANENFTLALSYRHPSLPGEQSLGERNILVKPVYVTFGEAAVSPQSGRWNDTYVYSFPLNASGEMVVALEVYNPCSHEWIERGFGASAAGESIVDITAEPFKYRCTDAEGKLASYRLTASFGNEDYSSAVYPGPFLTGGRPELVSLDYTPVLYVAKDGTANQVVRATIDSPLGRAAVRLNINGPGKNFEQQSEGDFLGGTRYMYTWSVPFTVDNVGNHTISLRYIHPEIAGGVFSFPEQRMTVVEEESSSRLPQLLYLDYLPILYIEDGEVVQQNITAEIFSPAGKGDLRFDIVGPDKNVEEIVKGEDKSKNVYVYRWSEPFNSSSAGKSYRISLTYLINGESYSFDDRIMSVLRKNGAPPQIWEPTLSLEYDRTLYIPEDGRADQFIRATINYTKGMGRLRLNLTGPDKDFYEMNNGQALGDDRYLYEWTVPFTEDNVGKDYRISLTYYHSSLAGGEYRFADKDMRVAFEPGRKDTIRFNNASVTPSYGSGLTSYTYCVDIETELKEADVQLLTSNPGSATFKTQYIVHYDGSNNALCWPDVAINSNQDGNASYKFLSGSASSQAYSGPRIKAIEVSGNVDPLNGVIQGFEGDNSLHSFTYTVSIENMSVNLSPWIELLVKSPNSSWRTVDGMKQYDPSKGSISWTEKPFMNAPFLDEAEFKFRIDGLETQAFKGPKIVAIYDEPGWVGTGSNKYSYWAWFEATEDLIVDLLHSSDGQRWIAANKPKTYEANSGRVKITWPNEPGYNKFEFDIKIEGQGGAS